MIVNNKDIEKFVRENGQLEIVQDLAIATTSKDKEIISALTGKIKRYIEIKYRVKEIEAEIKRLGRFIENHHLAMERLIEDSHRLMRANNE